MDPSGIAALMPDYRDQGMPIVAWTVRTAAEWDRLKPHCDNLIFEGFAA